MASSVRVRERKLQPDGIGLQGRLHCAAALASRPNKAMDLFDLDLSLLADPPEIASGLCWGAIIRNFATPHSCTPGFVPGKAVRGTASNLRS